VSSLTTGAVNIMNVLTQSALDSAANLSQYRLGLVQQQLQAQYNSKVKALQATGADAAEMNYLQVEISAAGAQKARFSSLQSQYGANANVLGDLSAQISALQDAATAGDASAFDAALDNANAYISDLSVIVSDPAMQPDGITQLKTNGLGIQSSAGYDLGTPEGQSAALADLNTAQNLITQIFQATAGNQTVAGSMAAAADSQLSSFNNNLETIEVNGQDQVALKTLQLKTQFTTLAHLIELSFANSSLTSQSLQQQETLQQQLYGAAPGTILSLFA